jgi:hypothetical protein
VVDVKTEFTRRAHFSVAGGYTITAPSSMTESSVVSRDRIRLTFIMAALNACQEKIWFEEGIEQVNES